MDKKDKFEAMLALAEFSAERMERRRTTEFQIFISYTTLIALGLYVIITKLDVIISKNNILGTIFMNNGAMWVCITLVLINFIYIIWQVAVGRAMNNDASRRNFYVNISQELIGHSPNEKKRGKGFENTIIVNGHYLHQFYDLHLIWKDWSRLLLIGIPTLLHTILLYEVFNLTNYPMYYFVVLILFPVILIVVGIIMEICRYIMT